MANSFTTTYASGLPAEPTVTTPTEITDADLVEMARAPKRTRTDEGFVEERSIQELLDADKQLAENAAADAVPWGMRVAKTKPPSTLS